MQEILKMKEKIRLFDGIDSTKLAPMLKCLCFYKKNVKKNTYFSMEEDKIQSIGIVLSGTIHMMKEDLWGNKMLITPIKEGELFGETFICSNRLASTVSFQAVTNCTVLFLPFQKVINTCSHSCNFHHRLVKNMMVLIAEKNLKLIKKIDITSTKSIREKISTYLVSQIQTNEKQIEIPFTRIELADYLSCNRSALTRELAKMKEEGLIDYDKNIFVLKSPTFKGM